MLKKVLIVSALFLSMVVLPNSTWAQSCPTPDGYYLLDGKLTAKANFPRFVTLSSKLPDLENIGAQALFDSSGVFSLLLPLLSADPLLTGTWAMVPATGCPKAFTVDSGIDGLIDELVQLGIEATITSESFTGTLQSDGTIKGTFNLGISITVPFVVTGTITVKGSFTGEPTAAPSSLSLPNLPEQDGSRGSSVLADVIIKFLKKIPVN